VQLKSRFGVYKKYLGRDIWIAFPCPTGWYLYPHDQTLALVLELTNVGGTESWLGKGAYHWGNVPPAMLQALSPFFIPATGGVG
jgi:hypothetical protein